MSTNEIHKSEETFGTDKWETGPDVLNWSTACASLVESSTAAINSALGSIILVRYVWGHSVPTPDPGGSI